MTPDEREMASAKYMREWATAEAFLNLPISAHEDIAAAAAAILCRALELATPELSPQARARLFLFEELPPSSLELEYDLGTYGDCISDEN